MAQKAAHKEFKAGQETALKLAAQALHNFQLMDELIDKAFRGVGGFPLVASILSEMKTNVRKSRKMMNTLKRKMEFGGSSLFLNSADEKMLTKIARQESRLLKDILSMSVKALTEAEKMEPLVLAARQRAAKQ